MEIEIKQIEKGTAEYALELQLRTTILRTPLGLSYSEADIDQEVNDIHFGAFREKQIVGCLLLRPVTNEVMKMRQVAVDQSFQSSGIGRKLVAAAENYAQEKGVTEIQLNARETAVPFYLKLGYIVIGGPFNEVGVPHFKMTKATT